jgi:transposase
MIGLQKEFEPSKESKPSEVETIHLQLQLIMNRFFSSKYKTNPTIQKILPNSFIKLFEHLSLNGISGAYIIMDNVRFHKTELVVNLIRSYGHKAVFLLPYSLFLNPIENLFNQWKNLIKRSEPQNEDQLYEAVHNASEKITPEN